MTVNEVAAVLREWDNLYILTHERPDGDTLGSAAALCAGLRMLGRRAFVVPNPEMTPRYAEYVAPYHAPCDWPPDDAILVAVDTASPERLPQAHRTLAAYVALSIDHHPSSAPLGMRLCVKSDSASTGEIIFEILQVLGVALTPEIALPLYLAVSTDTGCFRYTNTTAGTLRVAAALLDTGINVDPVNREMFEIKSRKRFQVEALMIDDMKSFYDGTVTICCLTQAILDRTGASEDDVDNIASLPKNIKGVDVGVVIREQPNGRCKISVRTSNRCEASKVCAQLGGGGHIRAAGCEIKGSVQEAQQAVLEAIGNSGYQMENDEI